jgi:hypothetical protein
MAMPTVPVGHFIVIETCFALDLLNALFDRVTGGGYLSQLVKRQIGGRIG